jgi:DNA-directed RNA polymerase I subunit RPA1
VFGAYGISVDVRHLALIADFMTAGGGYRGCSRFGIANCTSPLLKMSFETSAAFLKEAALRGAVDGLGSAAARIVLGQPVGLGTGCVALSAVLPTAVTPQA